MDIEDVTIIGVGPAGIATAMQLKRYGLKPLLLEKSHVGGLLRNANLVQNYPGFPQGISGPELVKLFKAQLEETGVMVSFEEVVRIDHQENFILKTSKREMRSRILVVASGTQPREVDSLDIPEEVADRVLYEVYPLTNIVGKKVAIIGAGDAAFDSALNLSRKNEVTILNRGEKRKCLPLLWERTQKLPQISYRENAAISEIMTLGDGLVLSYKDSQGKWELKADYAIFAIGRVAQLDYLSEKLQERASDLERDGVLYFVGDVKNDIYRQTSIAVGDGIRAAMKIYQGLQRANNANHTHYR